MKPGCKLMVISIPEFDRWSINVEKTRHGEISPQFVRRQVDCLESVLEMMKSGKINVRKMVTHRFPFEYTKKAFDLVTG